MCIGPRVKNPLFFSNLWSNCQYRFFHKFSNIKFHENPSSRSRIFPCGRTDGQTTDMKLIITFAVSRTALKLMKQLTQNLHSIFLQKVYWLHPFQSFCIENFSKIFHTYYRKKIQLEYEIILAYGPYKEAIFFAQFSNFLQIRIIECSVWPRQQVNPLPATTLPVYCSAPPVSTYIWYHEPFTSALDNAINHNTMSFFRKSCFKCSLGSIVTNLEQADNFDN
jgi:hypothetical protein